MIEIEVKCQLTFDTLPRVQELLQQYECIEQKRNHDIYYDTPCWNLLRQAVFLRVRNQRLLEWKMSPSAGLEHEMSTEKVFPLPLTEHAQEQVNTLFTRFLFGWEPVSQVAEAVQEGRLVELANIQNYRTIYRHGDLQLYLDQVAGLGTFLEIEATCEHERDATNLREQIHTLMRSFSLQHLPIGYVELWLQQHLPAAYLVGKYQL